MGALEDAQCAVDRERTLAEQLDHAELLATAHHDAGMVALESDRLEQAAELLAGALVDGARDGPGAAQAQRLSRFSGPAPCKSSGPDRARARGP
jgi:hypothetical protein